MTRRKQATRDLPAVELAKRSLREHGFLCGGSNFSLIGCGPLTEVIAPPCWAGEWPMYYPDHALLQLAHDREAAV